MNSAGAGYQSTEAVAKAKQEALIARTETLLAEFDALGASEPAAHLSLALERLKAWSPDTKGRRQSLRSLFRLA
jgi:hypothetical protein